MVYRPRLLSLYIVCSLILRPNMGNLALSLTGVGPSGPALTYMQIPLKVQKVRYRQKLGIPQAGS